MNFGIAEHVANADDRERSGGVTGKLDGVFNETRHSEASEKNNHAKDNGNDVGVSEDAKNEF